MIIIYFAICVWIVVSAFFKTNTLFNNKYTNYAILLLLFMVVSIAIYNVNLNSIPDAGNYANRTTLYTQLPFKHLNTELDGDALFNIIQWITAQFSDSIRVFLLVVWVIISINLLTALRNIFNAVDVLFVFFSFVSYFIFFDYALNTIRQGLAISFLILAISLLIKGKTNLAFYVPIIIAPLMHISALPLSLSLLLMKWFRFSIKTYIGIWVISAALFLTKLNSVLFGSLRNRLESYTSTYVLGESAANRIDFFIFGVFFAVFGLIMLRFTKNRSEKHLTLLKAYLIFNSYFLCLGFITFSDRLAAYSWMLVPILVWYFIKDIPILNRRLILIMAFILFSVLTRSTEIILNTF